MEILERLTHLEQEAAAFGFKWETADQILAQIRSELAEIEIHLQDQNKTKLQEEIGDLLHAAFSLCVFCQLDAEETLKNSVNKFDRRFKETINIAQNEGLNNLKGQSFHKLMEIWNKAKASVG